MKPTINIFWFRRDLRIHDNAGLYHALKGPHPVVPLFIFDRNILDELEEKGDRRVAFIHQALEKIQEQLVKWGTTLDVRYGFPGEIFKSLFNDYSIAQVFTNHDYEPYAKDRDSAVANLLSSSGVEFLTFKDQVIMEKNEVVKDDGSPYTIFTPYSRKWKSIVNDFYLRSYPSRKHVSTFYKQPEKTIPRA